MVEEVKKLFGPSSMQRFVQWFFSLIKLSLMIALFALPWTAVNLIFKFSASTFLIFLLAGLFLIPVLGAAFQLISQAEPVTFKAFWRQIRLTFKQGMQIGSLMLGFLTIYLLDIYFVLKVKQLSFLIPILYISLLFIAVCFLYVLFLSFSQKVKDKAALKAGAFLSWRYVGTSILIFFVLMLWLSLGYFLQGVNILLGNGLAWFSLMSLINHRVRKSGILHPK